MDKKLTNSLVAYGLTENEAKIYLYLLRKFEASVFEIAKETKIPRATTYITLDKMKDQSLVSTLRKNKVLYYAAESTLKLKTLLVEKQKIIDEILPELHSLTNTEKERTSTVVYKGESGVRIVLEDILETMRYQKLHTLYAASHPEILKYFPKYFPNWTKRREELNIRTKLIMPESEKMSGAFESNVLRETKYLPNKFPFQSTIEIYGSKLAVFSFKGDEIYSIIIESSSAVNMFKQFFLFAWEHATE